MSKKVLKNYMSVLSDFLDAIASMCLKLRVLRFLSFLPFDPDPEWPEKRPLEINRL